MGPPSYMRSVFERNVVMRRVPVFHAATPRARIQLHGSVVSLSSKDSRGKATAILSTGDFPQTVDNVKALTACHLFSVAGKPVLSREKAS
jgi:hypothetical protein